MGKGTIVLAYSGGLDTSICIPLLKERYDYDRVVTVAVHVGQRDEEMRMAEEKGKRMADSHYTIDAREKFVREYHIPCHKGKRIVRRLPDGDLARPAAHHHRGGESREERGCEGDRPRVYRERQRPAPFRLHHPRGRARGDRTDTGDEPHPRLGDRVCEGLTRSRCPLRKSGRGAPTRTAGAGASREAGSKTRATTRPRRSTCGRSPQNPHPITPKRSRSNSGTGCR